MITPRQTPSTPLSKEVYPFHDNSQADSTEPASLKKNTKSPSPKKKKSGIIHDIPHIEHDNGPLND